MAVDYSLKIDGIPGESAEHESEIEVLSWSWGETQTANSERGGGGSGKVQIQDFHFVMRTSKASPKLLLACAKGEHIATAVLSCRKAGGRQELVFFKYTLSDLLVSSFQTSGGADDFPTDQISLNFRRLEKEYRQQRPDGSLGDVVKAEVTKE